MITTVQVLADKYPSHPPQKSAYGSSWHIQRMEGPLCRSNLTGQSRRSASQKEMCHVSSFSQRVAVVCVFVKHCLQMMWERGSMVHDE